jgi:hypothetical protein
MAKKNKNNKFDVWNSNMWTKKKDLIFSVYEKSLGRRLVFLGKVRELKIF